MARKRKWEELDPFSKYDVIHEVEQQAIDRCDIVFSDDPAENLRAMCSCVIDLLAYFYRKIKFVIVSPYF